MQQNEDDEYRKKHEDLLEKSFEIYSTKCCQQIINLYNLVNMLLLDRKMRTNNMEENLTSLMNNNKNVYSLSDLYLRFIKPFYVFLIKKISPNDLNNFELPPKYAFIMMQISLVVIVKQLLNLEKATCNSINEYRKKLINVKKDLDIFDIENNVAMINSNLKLNTNIRLKNPVVPSEILEVYTVFFKEKLENSNILNGLDYISSINKKITNLLKTVNYSSLRNDQRIPKFEVPNEIQEYIPFVFNSNEDNNDLIKMLIEQKPFDCGKSIHQFSQAKYSVSPINMDCFSNMSNILDQMSEKAQLNNYDHVDVDSSMLEKTLEPYMLQLLDSLKEINIIADEYLTDSNTNMDREIDELLKNINPEMGDCENYAFENIQRMSQMTKIINSLNDYVESIDKKLNEHFLLRQQYYRLNSVDKSIMIYSHDVLLKNDLFLLSYFKFSWVHLFYNFVNKDLFNWLKDFNIRFNHNYLTIIGSINCRILVQYLYNNNENMNFFNNEHIQNKITHEYYNCLTESLGKLLREVLNEMLKIKKSIDLNKPITCIDITNESKIHFKKIKLSNSTNYEMCFSILHASNRGLNIIHFTCDYIVQAMVIKYIIYNKNFEDLEKLILFINNEKCNNLTNMVYCRWLLWLTIYISDVKGNDWQSCYLEFDKTKLKSLHASLIENLNYLKNNNPSIASIFNIEDENTIHITLSDVKKSVKIQVDKTKIKNYATSVDKTYPLLEDFLYDYNENKSLKHVPTFYNIDEKDQIKQIETKFCLLNKLESPWTFGNIYNYDASNEYFMLINVEKKSLLLKFK